MNYVPHRYGIKSVSRFIPVLETLVTNHRTIGEFQVDFDPRHLNLSVETAIARLRDAVHSLKNKLVTDIRINPEYLAYVWPHYRIESDGIMVSIKPIATLAQATTLNPSGALAELTVGQPAFAETLSELASLLSKRIFQGEVTINGNLPSDLIKTLEAKYDVSISMTAPNQHTML